MKINLTVLMLSTTLYWGCTTTLYVAPRQADCTGVAEQKCFLVRNSPTGNWILHNDKIKGFDYEPGFSYKLKVKKVHVKNPPADGSSINYILVETDEKRDVTDDMVKADLVGKEWKLEFLLQDRTQTAIEGTIPTLQFSDDGKINGNGGCNNYFGSYTLSGRTIDFGKIGSTKMMCPEGSELEQTYFSVLSGELRGLFSDGKLILSREGGNRLVFSYK
jgi:heat shock protein HslJ